MLLKRRCLHLYIPFPDAKLEAQIIAHEFLILKNLKNELVNFVQNLRELDLKNYHQLLKQLIGQSL